MLDRLGKDSRPSLPSPGLSDGEKRTLGLLTQHECCLIFWLSTQSHFHTANRSEIGQKRSICPPGTYPVPLRGPGITFWEWLILFPKSGRLDHCAVLPPERRVRRPEGVGSRASGGSEMESSPGEPNAHLNPAFCLTGGWPSCETME